MKDLIERLEKATGPDRRLDVAIYVAEFPHPCVEMDKSAQDKFDAERAPSYTSSIDAALTLVPEGWAWSVGSCCVSDDAWVVPDYNSPVHGANLRAKIGPPVKGNWTDDGIDIDLRPPGNPAIAICLAALMARESRA